MSEQNSLKDLRQLLRLRQLREESARQAREACQREVARLLDLRDEHERRWHALCEQRRQLGAWVDRIGASSMAQLNHYKSARREDLDELCERAEYDVIDDDERIAEARDKLAEANQAWVRGCAQRQAVEELLSRQQRQLRIQAELKQEREAA